MVEDSGSTLMKLSGVGPIVADRVLADVGDVTRFADRNGFASGNWHRADRGVVGGAGPGSALEGRKRRINHLTHIAAATQMRLDTNGRRYYRRMLAEGKTRMEALRCLKRRIFDALYRELLADALRSRAPHPERAREDTAGRL